VIADEAHEWPQATGIAFDLLCANLFKRSQPLLMVATNAGSDRNCFAWTLHERAANVLAGTSDDKTLLPVIYEAPKELDWRSEEAARAANPSIPDIVSFEQLKGEQAKGEARYRRLYLSQWVTGSDKWLEMDKWDACIGTIDPEALKDAPRYLGLDLSNGDDLCAMTDVLMAPDHCYVIPRFWMPKATAERYQNLDLVPYLEWAEQGAIELLTQPTISIIVQQQIAQTIIDSHKVHPINAVAYDRAYAGGVIELVRAAGIKCEPVPQGWTLWGACQELERRLTEKSITIAANPVARFCASNVTLTNNKGSYWPRKPDAKGRAGKMNKIDFISALVTALTEARKTSFPPPAPHVGALMLSI
jgi:phage terminase large subunit-like protein